MFTIVNLIIGKLQLIDYNLYSLNPYNLVVIHCIDLLG